MGEIKDVSLTLRISGETHRRLRFVAADQGLSLNELINRMLDLGLAETRVQLPNGLQYQPGSEQ
jgi:predicted DNA binding CopG/RHH family protein